MRTNASQTLKDKRVAIKFPQSPLDDLFIAGNEYYGKITKEKGGYLPPESIRDILLSPPNPATFYKSPLCQEKSPETRERGVSTGSTVDSENEREYNVVELFSSHSSRKKYHKNQESKNYELMNKSNKFYYAAENMSGPSTQTIPIPSLCKF